MKRTIALITAVLLMLCLSLAGCTPTAGSDGTNGGSGGGNTDATKKIDEAVVGTWYGPASNPVLNIAEDGSGTITYDKAEKSCTYTTDGGKLSISSEVYTLTGSYVVEGNLMTVTVTYEGQDYEVVFQRELYAVDAGYVYPVDEEYYEIILTPEGGCTLGEKEIPPSEGEEEKPLIYLYYVTKYIPEPGDTETHTEVIILELPPIIIYVPEPPTPTEPSADPTTPTDPPVPKDAVPEKVDVPKDEKDDPKVHLPNGKEGTGLKTGGSLVGTWTSAPIPGYVYILGFESTFEHVVTYTFNADGTGMVSTMGIFNFPLTYTFENNIFSFTVTGLGDVESGSGYAQIIGDVFYMTNDEGEVVALGKQ